MPALIFDCDGVMADTEQHGHLPAFNAMFEKFGLPVHWDVPTYAQKVKIGGGKERIASILTEEFVSEAGLPTDPEVQRSLVQQWHMAKTEFYTTRINSGVVPARLGIARIATEAHSAGWKLAMASTSAKESVYAVLRHAVGESLAGEFLVFAGDVVPRKKPAPDIYNLALFELGLSADDCIVIEDSEIGLRAATSAGLRTVITVSGFTKEENFSGASLVVSSLGEPSPGEPSVVLDDPIVLGLQPLVDLSLLKRILNNERPHRTESNATPEQEKKS